MKAVLFWKEVHKSFRFVLELEFILCLLSWLFRAGNWTFKSREVFLEKFQVFGSSVVRMEAMSHRLNGKFSSGLQAGLSQSHLQSHEDASDSCLSFKKNGKILKSFPLNQFVFWSCTPISMTFKHYLGLDFSTHSPSRKLQQSYEEKEKKKQKESIWSIYKIWNEYRRMWNFEAHFKAYKVSKKARGCLNVLTWLSWRLRNVWKA